MNLSPSTTRRLIIAGAVLAPVLLVEVAKRTLGTPPPGPVKAPAAVLPADPIPAAPVAPASGPTPEQQRAVAWLASGVKAPTKSPMEAPSSRREPESSGNEPAQRIEPPPPPAEGLPSLSLTLIMNTSAGGLATINGKVYRVGDSITAGWTVKSIDHVAWTVTLRHTDGREAEVSAVRR